MEQNKALAKLRAVIHCLPKEVEEINGGEGVAFEVYLEEGEGLKAGEQPPANPKPVNPFIYSGYMKGPKGTGYSHKNLWIQKIDFTGFPGTLPTLYLKYPMFHPNVYSSGKVCTGDLSSSWSKNTTVRNCKPL